jgi:glycosyltransferase involved in cell wall biosynthesis
MDDCSPDNTPEVAKSFQDPRVRHIRNEPNLGHLRNYNKGIALAQGKYVWLISADDRLRRPYVLARYVELMERRPEVGYACCPAVEIKQGQEFDIARYSVVADRDTVFKGRDFLKKLRRLDCVIAGSGMVRKSCYERLGAFPLDMPYAGDWYMWCLFALYYDVAYFAEPMVNYRIHELSMSNTLREKDVRIYPRDRVAVFWRVAHKADVAGARRIAGSYRQRLISEYVELMTTRKLSVAPLLSFQDFEETLTQDAGSQSELSWVRSRVYAGIADRYFTQRQFGRADEFYRLAIRENPWLMRTAIKSLLLHTGRVGMVIRDVAFWVRQSLTQN